MLTAERFEPHWSPTVRYPLIVTFASVIATYDGKRLTLMHRHRRWHRGEYK